MRAPQTFIGFVIVLIGLFLLLVTSGILALTLLDLVGVALVLSGLFFWVPGVLWRKAIPWLTSLFIPGTLAFAVGGILVYTARVGVEAWAYLWTVLVIALGCAFLAMHFLGPHARWLKVVGVIVGGVGVLLFALLLTALSPEPAARIIGPIVLIVLGLAFAVGALLPRR